VEDVSAAEMGVDHLISVGHRRIATVTGPLSLKNERQRLLGYEQALRRAGLAVENELIWNGNLRSEDVEGICRERLADPRHRPDAIFATNGPTGLGVLRALRGCGLRTPDDIAFATFDELTVDDLFLPAITTVVQPAYDIGFRAAEILLQRIEEGSTDSEAITIRLPASLKIRDSSGLPARRGIGAV
jgi:DNA-binding LacI/PurR family transcriptional regulator